MSTPTSTALALTLAFALALVAGLVVKFWLASRQVRHVARHRDTVPPVFAQAITLAAHQKAADYTMAKTRFGIVEMAWGAAVLLGWTLLGGLDLLNKLLLDWLGGGMLQQLALLAAFAMIGGLLELPFTLWQTFRLEERFGFNKMTWRLWLADAVKGVALGALIGLPIAALILWLMGAAGSLWWIWAWGVWMAFNLLLMLVYPTFIAPIFNKFQPLDDAALVSVVEPSTLKQRAGDRGADRPNVAGALHDLVDVARFSSVDGGETESRKEIGDRDADERVGRYDVLLGREHVGPTLEQL